MKIGPLALAQAPAVKRAVSLFCLGALILLQVFGASAALHRQLHPDADQPGHDCPILLFSHGKVHTADHVTAAVRSAVRIVEQNSPTVTVAILEDHLLPSGRAPPSGIS